MEHLNQNTNDIISFTSEKAIVIALIFILILLSGDIEVNPGPLTYDVGPLCLQVVAENHNAILCDNCTKWYHAKCVNMSVEDYKLLAQIDDFNWLCIYCKPGKS